MRHLALLQISGRHGLVAGGDPAALGGLAVLCNLQHLGVHFMHHQRTLEVLIHAGIAPITVFYQITVADGINALVLTKRKTIIAVIPICPQLHIFLISERSVVVGVFAHEIAACLRSLQPLNALQGRLKLKFQICTH